jgi:hypothetical protein
MVIVQDLMERTVAVRRHRTGQQHAAPTFDVAPLLMSMSLFEEKFATFAVSTKCSILRDSSLLPSSHRLSPFDWQLLRLLVMAF